MDDELGPWMERYQRTIVDKNCVICCWKIINYQIENNKL